MVAGRNRALLKTIIYPEKCEVEYYPSVIEKERSRNDFLGVQFELSSDLKLTALKISCDLDNHSFLNDKMLNRYEAPQDEVEEILDSRLGAKIRAIPIRPQARRPGVNDDMDVDACDKGRSKGGPGSGRGGLQFDRMCFNCGKTALREASCWSKRRRPDFGRTD